MDLKNQIVFTSFKRFVDAVTDTDWERRLFLSGEQQFDVTLWMEWIHWLLPLWSCFKQPEEWTQCLKGMIKPPPPPPPLQLLSWIFKKRTEWTCWQMHSRMNVSKWNVHERETLLTLWKSEGSVSDPIIVIKQVSSCKTFCCLMSEFKVVGLECGRVSVCITEDRNSRGHNRSELYL